MAKMVRLCQLDLCRSGETPYDPVARCSQMEGGIKVGEEAESGPEHRDRKW